MKEEKRFERYRIVWISWGIISLVGVFYFLRSPIVALDTDLWYHLAGGRFFAENREIPSRTFFSFLSPLREYINYYWLFQVLVFQIHSLFDYQGLIIFRAAIFGAALTMIWLLLADQQRDPRRLGFLYLLFIAYYLFIIPRFQLIRPHLFSYFFIIVFLYLFELHPRRLWILPFLGLLWFNLHGIEYHVALLICLSYLAEFLIGVFRRKERITSTHFRTMVPILVTMAFTYLTPHGARIFGVPLVPTNFASEYIMELRPVEWKGFFSLQFSLYGPSLFTLVNLIAAVSVLGLGLSIRQKKVRISHFLLLAGGFFLLFKGTRLFYEFVLLSLPILRSIPIGIPWVDLQNRIQKGWTLFLALLLIIPVALTAHAFRHPPRYPFSAKALPQGIVNFLKQIPAQGRVMNHPNIGGYLQWTLYPKYQILMDMQVPFVFHDEDFHLSSQAFGNAEVLRKLISQYEPSFIMNYLSVKDFKSLMESHPQYKIVFFDSHSVLYANENHYPQIVREFEIRHIDPYEVLGRDFDEVFRTTHKESFQRELEKIWKIDPEELAVNQLMALMDLKKGEFTKAMAHADTIVRNFPESPTGYRLKGDALRALQKIDEAIGQYEKALDRSDGDRQSEIYKKLGVAYGLKGDHPKAYRFMKKGILVFSPKTTYQELFDFAMAALMTGNYDEAYALLFFASHKVPPEDREFQEKIRGQLSKFVPRSAG